MYYVYQIIDKMHMLILSYCEQLLIVNFISAFSDNMNDRVKLKEPTIFSIGIGL